MATAVQDPLVGRLVDSRYQVLERIASGGMATVYLATDTRLERSVALKVMHAHLAADASFVARFTREARSAARLSHPGVVAVYDQGAGDGTVYLAMEHVPGRTLRDLVAAAAPLPLGEALDLADEVLDALAAAHAAGLVHRDVKPENVLVGDDGRLRVADFGLARAATGSSGTATSTLMGTVGYLAPELVLHGTSDARADVYAAGVVLYELLTGRAPFGDGVPAQVAFRHVSQDVPRPSHVRLDVPAAVDELVARATDRDPGRRPRDAGQMLAELRAVVAGLDPTALDGPPVLRPTATVALPGTRRGTRVAERAAERERVVALPVEELRAAGSAATRPTPVVPAAPAAGTAPLAPPAGPARPAATDPGPGSAPPRAVPRRRLAVLLASLAAVVLLLGGGVLWAETQGPLARVTVPALAGRQAGDAAAVLRREGLLVTQDRVPDDHVGAGLVIAVAPGPGTRVAEDTTVVLRVSAGPELHRVPDLSGMTEAQARAAVTGAGLAVGPVLQDWSATVPAGRVASQQTPLQPPLRAGSRVSFTLSKGPEPIQVPQVVGRVQSDAEKAITDAGLVVGTVTHQPSTTVAAGAVVGQSATGALHHGDPVDLVVSSGPPVVSLPDETGQDVDTAKAALTALGLQVQVAEVFGAPLHTVRQQSPAPGQVPVGSTVTLTVL